MKDLKTKERFVELRAEGRSFDSIAKELNVCKNTLLSWNIKLDKEIKNQKYYACQSLIEQYKLTQIERINFVMQELQKINNAISQKDMNELSYKDLISLKEKYDNQLKNETSNLQCLTGEFEFEGLKDAEKEIDGIEIIIPLE